MNQRLIYILLLSAFSQFCVAQNPKTYKVWNPANDTVSLLNGQAWAGQVQDYYDRFPAKAEKSVANDVWKLSKNNTGLNLRFRTNADEIVIKYVVNSRIQMPHMPATGVSGVDLYGKDADGNWIWGAGKYSFGDTIVYRFANILPPNKKDREYTLYLPLYNSLKWMEVQVPTESSFTVLPKRSEKPIVVYGTSIAQGACASRPGLTWTSILSRKLDIPMINLGFSGSGRLEKPIIDLLTEIDAKVYVLDCLPNLTYDRVSDEELARRISASVLELQDKRPGVPIVLTEHSGYTNDMMNPAQKAAYEKVNAVQKKVFAELKEKGLKDIYLLSKNEIGQNIETMVDGTHPNDIGMMRYADAYEKTLRVALNLPVGVISTTIPVTQYRELPGYDWEKRHSQVMERNKQNSPSRILIGNSITHFWAGEPVAHVARGEKSWNKYFGKEHTTNMGFGWDRIENVLWRVHHGELDGIAPKQIILLIGTNNLGLNTDEEIAEGLSFLLKAIKLKQPNSEVVVLAVLPRRKQEERVKALNIRYAKVAKDLKVKFVDAGKQFINSDGKVNESLFTDGLHPNEEGYEKLGKILSDVK